jgi:calcineurin-like phosphoesterase family protein
MTRFFTSDTHFGHANIIRYCERPFSDYETMDAAIIKNWNAVVGDTDVVYHLGDLALGPSERWDWILKSLNGYKIFVVGNHDRIFAGEKERQRLKWDEKYHEWFDEVYDNYEGLVLSNGLTVNLSHFPYEADHMDEARYMEYRLEDKGVPLIHGHTHATFAENGEKARYSRSKARTPQVHVGMDSWHYKPVSEDDVIDLFERF